MASAAVSLESIEKRFGDTVALAALTLTAQAGEFLVLLGPSGCGKSTALRIVAGLETPTAGTVRIGDRVVNDVEPKDRDVAMVFQSYALYPHLTVRRNIEFPLRARRVPAAERDQRVKEAARSLQLEELLNRTPGQLSGGQRQRVALARAIVREPEAFLMDEPLSNLDARLRVEMRAELIDLHRKTGTTVIYVTHDQVEAMTMGDRIAILRAGVLQQVGSPKDVHARPANQFVASFIGSPPMNLLPGETLGEPNVTVGIRPEGLSIREDGPLEARVSLVESLGHEHHVACRLVSGGESLVIVRLPASAVPPSVGDTVRLAVSGPVHRFDPTSGERKDEAAIPRVADHSTEDG
ncbi:MAG: ABC transporter ATP-binding protein [Acidimicrobiales bacterium]